MRPVDPSPAAQRVSRGRQRLALARLALLYGLCCAAIVIGGILWRHVLALDWGLQGAAPAAPALSAAGVSIDLLGHDEAAQRTQLDRLRNDGFDWVHQRFAWDEVEPHAGRYTWQASDALLAALDDEGLEIVALLDGSPAWAREKRDREPVDNALAPPEDYADFAGFAGAFAARYGDQLRYYQIWHEPNIAPHWGARHIDPVGYAQLLRATSAAIRAADPDAIIISAALAPTADRGHQALDEVSFLQRMIAADGAEAFDVVAIQPFGFGYAPEKPDQRQQVLNFARAAWVRRALQSAGHGEIPLWATAYGWNRQKNAVWGTVTPTDQNAYAARAIMLASRRWPWLTAMAWPAGPVAPGFALTPDLTTSIVQAARSTPPRPGADPLPEWLGLVAFVTGMSVLLWRGVAAARLLAWRDWLDAFRSQPWLIQLTAWAALALLYHFAVWPPLIGLCWIVALFLTAAQPRVGLGLALLLLPFFYWHKAVVLVNRTVTVPPAYVLLLGLLPTLSLDLWQRLRQRTDHFYALDWLAVAWLLVSLVAAANVWHWPGYGRGLLDLVLIPLILYLAIRTLLDQPCAWRSAAGGLAIGGVLVALLGLGGWLRGMGTTADSVLRLIGPHFSPNHTALYLERTLFLLAGFTWTSRGNWRWVGLAALGCTSFALLLTASRGAWLLGVPVGALCFALLVGPGSAENESAASTRPRMARLGLATLALIAVMAIGVAGFGWERLLNQATVLDRLTIWRSSAALWRDFPVAGAGPGGFYWRYPAYLPPGSAMDPNLRHPHNLWLEFGSMWGVIGLGWIILALGVVWSSLGGLWRNWPAVSHEWMACRPITAGLIAGLAAGVAHGQVDAFGALADLAAWNWAAVGLLSVLVIHVRGETNE